MPSYNKPYSELTEEQKEAIRERSRRYYWAHAEERKAYERSRGGAIKSRDNRKARTKLREEGFEHYGRICACCGEANPKFLTFDHPENNGAAHKVELAGSYHNASSSTVLRGLRSLGWPAGVLVVLCWNCNSGRHFNGGICPHKE